MQRSVIDSNPNYFFKIRSILTDETENQAEIMTIFSSDKLIQLLKSFPFAELKIFSMIDRNYDQFSINKQGELCIVKKSFLSQLFFFFYNDPGLPPLTVIKNVLTQARKVMKTLNKYWPNEPLMLAFKESDKETLREMFDTILEDLNGSLAGLSQLQKIHSNNEKVDKILEAFKNEIIRLLEKVLKKRLSVPEDDLQLDIIELIATAVAAADIDTSEDLTFALQKCNMIIAACKQPNEKSHPIQEKIQLLKEILTERLAQVKVAEDALENEIFNYK